MLHQSCSLVAELHYTFLHTYLLKSVIMVPIIIFLLVVVSNIHQGSSTPAAVDVNKSPLDNAVDGLYKCLEGSTNHGRIPKERVDYWNRRHPLNFIVDTLMKELPRIFEEDVFKSLIRNQATVMIAALELCRPNVHGYDDESLRTVLKFQKTLADQLIDEAGKAQKLIEQSIPYQALYEAIKKNPTTSTAYPPTATPTA